MRRSSVTPKPEPVEKRNVWEEIDYGSQNSEQSEFKHFPSFFSICKMLSCPGNWLRYFERFARQEKCSEAKKKFLNCAMVFWIYPDWHRKTKVLHTYPHLDITKLVIKLVKPIPSNPIPSIQLDGISSNTQKAKYCKNCECFLVSLFTVRSP